jgi:ketosteroid isomerase-like protein
MSTTDRTADELELRALAARYAIAADQGDNQGYADVFLPDGHLLVYRAPDFDTPATDRTGAEQLAQVPTLLADRYDRTFHFVGQSIYTIGEAVASGHVYCLAHHLSTTEQGGTSYVMHMRYKDEYRRDADGAWRIAERRAEVDWTETRPTNPLGG